MKLTIFGATGRTGQLLVKQALDAGHELTLYVRNAKAITIDNNKIKVVQGDLSNTIKLTEAITGADACVSVLGGNSLTKHAYELCNGIENIVTVMELYGVKRFIYLSSLGAGNSKQLMPVFARFLIANLLLRVPLQDHTRNQKHIAQRKLQWTILQPGGLTDKALTGVYNFGSEMTPIKGSVAISRANVAHFILTEAVQNKFIGKEVWLYE
ncbi:MAG: NAD(P)-dependent oxidoreductase [Paludibacter sp.]